MFKFLFFPISFLYGLLVFTRRRIVYGLGLKKRKEYNIPVICIGNLSMGGTGKTPHTEYLVRWLKGNYKIATLSRGYKRKTKGFICANEQHTVHDIGDEPMQYFTEFKKEVIVAVDEKRVRGVDRLMNEHPDLQVIILDDAYQHLSIKAGYNILLTDYFTPFYKDFILPMGRLREQRSAAKYADTIIVTKCPKILSPITRDYFLGKLKPAPHQKVFFSYFSYGSLTPITPLAEEMNPKSISQILLLTGIVNPYPLKEHLMNQFIEIHNAEYPDHHAFTIQDLAKIKQSYSEIITSKKAIITTQKDAMRLLSPEIKPIIQDLPVFYVPLEVKFHDNSDEVLKTDISNFIQKTMEA